MGPRLGRAEIIEQTILHHPVRIMTIAALHVAIAVTELTLQLHKVGISNLVYLATPDFGCEGVSQLVQPFDDRLDYPDDEQISRVEQ